MTPEEIRAGLHTLQPWFHRIDLGGGFVTKTQSVMGEPIDHPAPTWQVIQRCLPAELAGKSVLDVGCNAGFYAFECNRRGAARVLGVDGQRQHVRQALFVRKALGLEVEFRRLNVYDLSRETVGEFDIVLALGLLYHLKHLVRAIENLHDVTRDLLVIETAILPPEHTPPSFDLPLGDTAMRVHHLGLVENEADAKEQVFNWFLPGVESLRALLCNAGFSDTEVVEVKNGRAVVVCRKTAVGEQTGYAAELKIEDAPSRCGRGETIGIRIRANNIGSLPWACRPADAAGTVHAAAHLLAPNEDELEWDFARGELPRDVAPGDEVRVVVQLHAPDQPGTYIVEFDMVAEHVTWFEDYGPGTARHQLVVS